MVFKFDFHPRPGRVESEGTEGDRVGMYWPVREKCLPLWLRVSPMESPGSNVLDIKDKSTSTPTDEETRT